MLYYLILSIYHAIFSKGSTEISFIQLAKPAPC